MRCSNGFLRVSSSGKFVGVLKYRDPAGQWRQITKTFTRERQSSEREFAAWRSQMANGGNTGPADSAGPTGAPSPTGAFPIGAFPIGAFPTSPIDSQPVILRPEAEGSPQVGAPEVPRSTRDGGFGRFAHHAPGSFPVPIVAAGAIGDGGSFAMRPPTVEQAVLDCLETQFVRGRIELSTMTMQLAYARRSLFPQLGALRIDDLTPRIAQSWVDQLCLELAPGSVRIVYSTLHKACARAVANGELAGNPLDLVEPPPMARPARAYLPAASVELLEAALDREWGAANRLTCATRLALHAGLRAGEACALRWRDVDLDARRLRVVSAVGRTETGFYLKGPKCAASAREFPIVDKLAMALETRFESCTDAARDPDRFICGNGDGGDFGNPRSLSNAFARLCERSGVCDNNGRRANFHMLRHTFATQAVRVGVDVRTLADLMGHARADITLNVYAATGEDAKLAAVERLNGMHRP